MICCSLDDAIAARDGGADRLEICSHLDKQGLTPPVELVAQICKVVQIPVRVMIRVRDGFGAIVDDPVRMEEQVRQMSHLPLDGIIFGQHDREGRLDFAGMDRVLRSAPANWGWTLHRAFDYAAGTAEDKLAAVANHGRADRILTADAWRLKPPPGLQFIAGGGLNLSNLHEYIDSPCREFHFGRAVRTPEETGAPVDRAKVSKIAYLLRKPNETFA